MSWNDILTLIERIQEDKEAQRDWEAALHGAERTEAPQQQPVRQTPVMAKAMQMERELQTRLSGRR